MYLKKRNIKFFLLLLFLCLNIFSLCICFTYSTREKQNFNKNYKTLYKKIEPSEQGFINSSGDEIFWFIHISDIQNIWGKDSNIECFKEFLTETYKDIQPAFIINTGDIIFNKYELFMDNERNQQIEAHWKKYKSILDETNMNSSIYMDIVGNHDVNGDPDNSHFLKYSMIGSTFNALQYSFKKCFSFGDYVFIGLHTAEDNGVHYPFGLFGYLNVEELGWYEKELKKYQNYEKIFVFGHHPPLHIYPTISPSGKTFIQINEENNVFLYLSGHEHVNSFQNVDGMFILQTKNFDGKNGAYTIVSIDNNFLSTSFEKLGNWPQGIITYPPRNKYRSNDLSPNSDDLDEIRVLTWDPKGINSVKWAAFDENGENKITNWIDLENQNRYNPLYKAKWDKSLNDGKTYQIKVKIKGESGEVIKSINYNYDKKSNFYINSTLLIIILLVAFISLPLILITFLKKKILIIMNSFIVSIDKKLRNYYLIKFIAFFLLPLTFGGMFLGQLTAMFSFFYLNAWGIHFNIILLLISGLILLLSVFLQPSCLFFKKKQRIFLLSSVISLSTLIFIIIFMIIHYPYISWFSPGLYTMILMDILMIRRNNKKNKQNQNLISEFKNSIR